MPLLDRCPQNAPGHSQGSARRSPTLLHGLQTLSLTLGWTIWLRPASLGFSPGSPLLGRTDGHSLLTPPVMFQAQLQGQMSSSGPICAMKVPPGRCTTSEKPPPTTTWFLYPLNLHIPQAPTQIPAPSPCTAPPTPSAPSRASPPSQPPRPFLTTHDPYHELDLTAVSLLDYELLGDRGGALLSFSRPTAPNTAHDPKRSVDYSFEAAKGPHEDDRHLDPHRERVGESSPWPTSHQSSCVFKKGPCGVVLLLVKRCAST